MNEMSIVVINLDQSQNMLYSKRAGFRITYTMVVLSTNIYVQHLLCARP